MPKLEIAAASLQDALCAQDGGADSVEVSANLEVGGLSPPFEVIQAIIGEVQIDVHVIVRPHAESFQYSPADIACILRDCTRFAGIGVKSIVFGAWDSQSQLDLNLIEKAKLAATPVPITVHRAIDQSVDPERSLDALVKLGIRRVLTSGPAANAWEGRVGLARWIAAYGSHISFVVSGGLKMEDLSAMIPQLNAPEYHFGSAARSGSHVDVAKVRQLREALER